MLFCEADVRVNQNKQKITSQQLHIDAMADSPLQGNSGRLVLGCIGVHLNYQTDSPTSATISFDKIVKRESHLTKLSNEILICIGAVKNIRGVKNVRGVKLLLC